MNIKKIITRKINSKFAFSMAETLVAILIMLMVSTIVAAGMPAARNAYDKVMKAADAEVLLSTTISTLKSELGLARNVDVKDNSVTYFNNSIDASSRISKGDYTFTKGKLKGKKKNDTFIYQKYVKTLSEQSDTGSPAVLLVSEVASGGDLYVTYNEVVYDKDNGIVKYTDIAVRDEAGKKVTGRDSLSIRIISH